MTRAVSGAVIVALLLLAGYLGARGAYWYESSDFFCLYQGGHALLTGHDPYVESFWATVTGGTYPLPTFRGGEGASSCPGRFGYPLWTAVAMLPFAALPLEGAATLWAAVSIGAAVAGMAWSWRAFAGSRDLARLFAVMVVASPMFWLLLISGQITGVELALAGAVALALARGRASIAGLALALMTLKPQIVGVTVPAVVVRAFRSRSLVLAALATLAVMTLLAVMFRPAWPLEWLGEVGGRRLRVTSLLPTAWGLSADLFGDPLYGAALIALLLVALVAIARGRRRSSLDVFVLSLPVSLFATPYAWSYDQLLLAPCWAYVLALAPNGRRLATELAIAMLAVAMPWVLYAIAFARGGETLTAIVPALTAILVALALPRA